MVVLVGISGCKRRTAVLILGSMTMVQVSSLLACISGIGWMTMRSRGRVIDNNIREETPRASSLGIADLPLDDEWRTSSSVTLFGLRSTFQTIDITISNQLQTAVELSSMSQAFR
jgi:hypothetical protein